MSTTTGWRTFRTSELIDQDVLAIGDGYRAKNSELDTTGIPFARAGNINGGFNFDGADLFPAADLRKVGEKISRPGDVVFTSKGTVGRFAFVREETPAFVYSPQLCYWRSLSADTIDPRYLFYWMQGGEFWLQAEGVKGQTDMADYVSLGDQRRMFLTLPPPKEQRDIARILGALDDKIELNRRMNRTMEAIVQALFRSWFVDFEPVSAKREGRKPVGMDAATAALFPEHFQDTAMGAIPLGWRVASIYDAAKVIYGAPFASKSFNSNGDGIPLIRIRDLASESPSVFTTEAHPKGYLVQPGDIVVGMDGEFRSFLWGGVSSWLNQRVCVFKPAPPFSAPFVRCNIMPLLAELEATETATTVIHLGKNDIDRFKIIDPGPGVLDAFNRICQPCYDRIVKNKQQLRNLTAMRDTLLPQLLSGDLRIGKLEEELP
jgi:type I restriction enzyme S subunit